MDHFTTLEFDTILNQLADRAVSDTAKERCQQLTPAQSIQEARRRMDETTQAKKILEQAGAPPLPMMAELKKIIALLNAEATLTAEQAGQVAVFLMACRRMKAYLKRAEATGAEIAFYGNAILDISHVEDEINRCVHSNQLDDRASPRLYELRRDISLKEERIKNKLDSLLRKNPMYFSDSFTVIRNGRLTLPVKREHKSKIPGVMIDASNTGGTCYIEPTAARELHDELYALQVEENNEVLRILYALTAMVFEELPSIRQNVEALETLDFLFAKGKLSMDMKASPIRLTEQREVRLLSARHPLLNAESAVPLDFALGLGGTRLGVVITGPNTGGKTVALKTVGLLSLMAQSGLHVPADESGSLCVFDAVYCDIGDGQSISENLSTFSSHITNIIAVLSAVTRDSLVLFDELGSGTDPAEGMGIAAAVLEELRAKECFFAATTHYPEIKGFAARTPGLVNARMAFDRKSLMPLYRLEIGEAGESCALFIAERLGMPPRLLQRAREIRQTYGVPDFAEETRSDNILIPVAPLAEEPERDKPEKPSHSQRFTVGDSVIVYPKRDIGIVYAAADEQGFVGVQVKKQKQLIKHKRLKIKVAATELYPDDYDFSIIFDSVENRKARHIMDKKHVDGNVVVIKK